MGQVSLHSAAVRAVVGPPSKQKDAMTVPEDVLASIHLFVTMCAWKDRVSNPGTEGQPVFARDCLPQLTQQMVAVVLVPLLSAITAVIPHLQHYVRRVAEEDSTAAGAEEDSFCDSESAASSSWFRDCDFTDVGTAAASGSPRAVGDRTSNTSVGSQAQLTDDEHLRHVETLLHCRTALSAVLACGGTGPEESSRSQLRDCRSDLDGALLELLSANVRCHTARVRLGQVVTIIVLETSQLTAGRGLDAFIYDSSVQRVVRALDKPFHKTRPGFLSAATGIARAVKCSAATQPNVSCNYSVFSFCSLG